MSRLWADRLIAAFGLIGATLFAGWLAETVGRGFVLVGLPDTAPVAVLVTFFATWGYLIGGLRR